MQCQIVTDFAVRFHDLADQLRLDDCLLQFAGRARCGGDQAFDLELVRLHHQPNHRLLIIRITADIREDNESRLGCEFGSADRQQSRNPTTEGEGERSAVHQ